MEIRTQISFNSPYLPADRQKQSGHNAAPVQEDSKEPKAEALEKKSRKADYAPDLKETAREMLSESEKLGTFKDKKGLEEATDVKIGPDIRFALRSKNPDFLQRILWGPLTVAEFREVKYRLREIKQEALRDSNSLSGKIISDTDLIGGRERSGRFKNSGVHVDYRV